MVFFVVFTELSIVMLHCVDTSRLEMSCQQNIIDLFLLAGTKLASVCIDTSAFVKIFSTIKLNVESPP